MKKKIGVSVIIILLIAAIVGIVYTVKWVQYDNSQKVEFADEEMGKVIAATAGIEDVSKFRKSDFENIKELNIGYTGYYDTLVDIEKCYNLNRLYIGSPETVSQDYCFSVREVPEEETSERIEQIQEELGSILSSCPNISLMIISNEEGNCKLNSLGFLSKGQNLTLLSLYAMSDIDYTPIYKQTNLVSLDLWKCDISDLEGIDALNNLEQLFIPETTISEVGDIVNLKNLNSLDIRYTPLEENDEEIALLYEVFPDLDLWTDM